MVVWGAIALPVAVLLSVIDLPKSYTVDTVMRFPSVEGAQSDIMRDVAITQSQSIVNLFKSYSVLESTVKKQKLQLRLNDKSHFRLKTFDYISYTDELGVGAYEITFLSGGNVRLDYTPTTSKNKYSLFTGPLINKRTLEILGLQLIFSTEFLKSATVNSILTFDFHTKEEIIETLRKKFDIAPLGGANFKITLKDRDPWLVADILNQLRDEFLDVYYGTTDVQDVSVLAQMEKNLALAKDRLEKSQNELSNYYKEHPELIARENDEEGSSLEYLESRSELADLRNRIARLKGSYSAKPLGMKNTEYYYWSHEILSRMAESDEAKANILRNQIQSLNENLNQAQSTYNPGHPKVEEIEIRLKQKYSEIDEVYAALMNKLNGQESRLQQQMAANAPRRRARASVKVQLELERLVTNNTNNERTYDRLLTQFNRAKLSTGSEFFKVNIVDKARPALYEPPSLKGRLIIAGIAAFILGFLPPLFVIGYNILFVRIWTQDDIKNFLNLKCLGFVNYRKVDGYLNLPLFGGSRREHNSLDPLLLYHGDSHTLEDLESYRAIREECLTYFSEEKSGPALVLLTTSTRPGEGKSTCSSNLALSFARTGKKVLLIDAELRLGQIDIIFGKNGELGLMDLLRKPISSIQDFLEECKQIIMKTDQENLDIVSKGKTDPSAAEMVGSEKLRAFIEWAKMAYDIVIIDTPPLAVTADPLALLNEVDGVVFVTRSGRTILSEARECIQSIRERKVRVGVILNRASVSPFKHNKYRKYGYYYKIGN